MRPFIQLRDQQTTISNWRNILDGNTLSSFGAFAYVTDSGVAQLITHLAGLFDHPRSCRWVFGFDYGRSQPTAIRKLAEHGMGEIRIYDGDYIVQSKGFTPRRSYHLKTALTLTENNYPCKQIIGSGNLSSSGLMSGIEAGCIIDYSQVDGKYGNELLGDIDELWNQATPFEDVIDEYEHKYIEMAPRKVIEDIPDENEVSLFWIDVGYVTKNRGAYRPGNQFDLPKGSHIYLGIDEVVNPELNSILGELRIRTPTNDVISRTLRFGNNSMEKLTLPIPERFGYQSYDGKILTFEVVGNEVVLQALEHDDFMKTYGMNISSSMSMQSGRLYGTIALKG